MPDPTDDHDEVPTGETSETSRLGGAFRFRWYADSDASLLAGLLRSAIGFGGGIAIGSSVGFGLSVLVMPILGCLALLVVPVLFLGAVGYGAFAGMTIAACWPRSAWPLMGALSGNVVGYALVQLPPEVPNGWPPSWARPLCEYEPHIGTVIGVTVGFLVWFVIAMVLDRPPRFRSSDTRDS